MLQMTAAAGHHLQEGRLYKAFRLLEQVRAGLPAATAPADKGAALCAPPWAQHDQTGRRRLPQPCAECLRSLLSTTLPSSCVQYVGVCPIQQSRNRQAACQLVLNWLGSVATQGR